MTFSITVADLHARYLKPRVLMLLFTLEASAVTNLLTSLAGSGTSTRATPILLASLFFLIAASYALAAEGLLLKLDNITKDFPGYHSAIQTHSADFGTWLVAQVAGISYGTMMLWPVGA